ncbi:hypothetical protein [Leucobacter sp. GX24907]
MTVLQVELPSLGDRDAPLSASLVQRDQTAVVERDGARLERFTGRILEIRAVGNPLEDKQLRVIEAEIHTSILTGL